MKINFLTYANTPNPAGIPAAWPAQVQAVDDTAPAPSAPWQQMTVTQYQAYLTANQSAYDAWIASQQSTAQSNLSTLATQYDAAINAMQNFAAIGSPTTTQAVSAVQTHNTILLKLLPILRAQYVQSLQ